MDASTLFLALPIFMIVYAGAELLLNSRQRGLPFLNRGSANFQRRPLSDFSRQIGQMGLNQALLKIRGFRQRLDRLLLRSGYPFGWKAEDVLFYKEATVFIAAVVLWQSGSQDPLTWLLTLGLAFWLMDFYLQGRGNSRRMEMQRGLPGLIDLMSLAIESGMDLMVALERIFEKMKPGALREELQALLQESRLGASRKEILQRWAHRTGLDDVQSLTSLIIQSEEMGTPLANVLRSYAEDMRTRRVMRAEEQAGKIPVKILFPMLVFFFPIVFVIILGPVALQFFQGYK